MKTNEIDNMVSLNARMASSHLYECMYAEHIKEDDSGRVWIRYPGEIEVVCSHIARAFETTHTQVFMAGVLYDNNYCGTNIVARLKAAIKRAMMSDNSYLRQSVCNGSTTMKLFQGRRKKFRMDSSVITTLRNEAKNTNLPVSDIGMLRFYCFYSDLMGPDTELVDIKEFKEFNRVMTFHKNQIDDLNDYVVDLVKRV